MSREFANIHGGDLFLDHSNNDSSKHKIVFQLPVVPGTMGRRSSMLSRRDSKIAAGIVYRAQLFIESFFDARIAPTREKSRDENVEPKERSTVPEISENNNELRITVATTPIPRKDSFSIESFTSEDYDGAQRLVPMIPSTVPQPMVSQNIVLSKVLVVDDAAITVKMIRMMLASGKKFSVDKKFVYEASNGRDAVKLVKESKHDPFDLIILDYVINNYL